MSWNTKGEIAVVNEKINRKNQRINDEVTTTTTTTAATTTTTDRAKRESLYEEKFILGGGDFSTNKLPSFSQQVLNKSNTLTTPLIRTQ